MAPVSGTADASEQHHHHQQQQQRLPSNSFQHAGRRRSFCILALYEFVSPKLEPSHVETLRREAEVFLRGLGARGNIILATEGINGTICYPSAQRRQRQKPARSSDGPPPDDDNDNNDHHDDNDDDDDDNEGEEDDDPVGAFLLDHFPGLRMRVSWTDTTNVFFRLKVRVKSEIVTMGQRQQLTLPSPQPPPRCEEGGEQEEEEKKTRDGGGDIVMTISPDPTKHVGTYVQAGPAWDALVRDPECLLIDCRNEYEIKLGTFEGAIDPGTQSFTEFPRWLQGRLADRAIAGKEKNKKKKIAMFCTGGIRCEKATSYCVQYLNAYDNNKSHNKQRRQVEGDDEDPPLQCFHLRGGILAYLAQMQKGDNMEDEERINRQLSTPAEESSSTSEASGNGTWRGECYVFDQRVAVTAGLEPTSRYTSCFACRHPLSPRDRASDLFVRGVSCPYCHGDPERAQRRRRYVDRNVQMTEVHQQPHLYDAKEVDQRLGVATENSSR